MDRLPIQFFWIDFRSDPIAQKWIYILSDPIFQRWIGTLSISDPYPVDLIFISFYPAYLHVYPFISNKFFKYQTNIFKIMGPKNAFQCSLAVAYLKYELKSLHFCSKPCFLRKFWKKKWKFSWVLVKFMLQKMWKRSKTWIWIGEKKFAYPILSDPDF